MQGLMQKVKRSSYVCVKSSGQLQSFERGVSKSAPNPDTNRKFGGFIKPPSDLIIH